MSDKNRLSEEAIQATALEIAERGMELVRHLSETKGKGFTDGYHKYAGDLIAAMNATRAALQTALVYRALTLRAVEIQEPTLRLAPAKKAQE